VLRQLYFCAVAFDGVTRDPLNILQIALRLDQALILKYQVVLLVVELIGRRCFLSLIGDFD